MQDKLVSIIVPVYNSQNYLAKTILSIRNQTYRNIEIIIIDDDSTDLSNIICNQFRKEDNRIHLYKQSKQGVSAARNFGIRKAQGKYCCFVDSDDLISPDYVQELLLKQHETDAQLVYCDVVRKNEDGVIMGAYDFLEGNYKFENKEEKYQFVIQNYLEFKIGFAVWNKLFDLDIIRINNITFDERICIAEDLGFVMNYIVYITSISHVKRYLYTYYERDNSLSVLDRGDNIFMNEYVFALQHIYQNISQKFLHMSMCKNFYLIFAKTMNNQSKIISNRNLKEPIKKIEQYKFYRKQLLMVIVHPLTLIRIYGKRQAYGYWKDSLLFLLYSTS